MDISKLPKLSDTKGQSPREIPPPDSAAAAQAPPVGYHPYAQRPPGIGGEIWISLIIGILLAFLGGNFARYLTAKISHQPYHTGFTWDSDGPKGPAGSEIAYFDLPGFTAWSDMGIFLFGLTLLFEAAAKTFLLVKPGKLSITVLMLAILLTLLAVVLNIIACMKMFSVDIIPMLSGLAVAFGGWILFDEWATLKRINPNYNRG